jgi:hypothetical protein
MFSKIALLFVAIISFDANAQAVFRHDSKLPSSLRSIVAAVINYNCRSQGHALFERDTTVRIDDIDQGMRDYFYTTTLVVKDNQRKDIGEVVVESFDIDMFNPTAGVTEGVSAISSDIISCK